jgi:hypothetical protein
MSFLSGRTSLTTVQTGDIAANAIDSTLTKDALIADYTEVTIAAGDSLLLGDVGDSGNTKRDTVQGLLDLAGGLTVGGVVATTSGTDISLGSSLSNVARMTISYETQSLASGTPKLQIGDSGGFHTSGYTGIGFRFLATSVEEIDDTAGFLLSNATAGSACSGIAFITLQDSTNFKYSFHTVNSMTAGDDRSFIAGGSVTLDTEMTQIRLSGGTWDLGSANIIIESKA